MNTIGERILFAYEAIDIYRGPLQQIERGTEASTTRTDNRNFIHNDPRGIQDAVIDLYSLANCRKLIGSYWSSFSEVAAQLRGIELVIAKDPIATETLPQKIPAACVSRGAA